MKPPHRILTINPGSTSTKAVLFEGEEAALTVELDHAGSLGGFARVMDQLSFRMEALREALKSAEQARLREAGRATAFSRGAAGVSGVEKPDARGVVPESGPEGRLDAVVGRGGFLSPVPGGVYAVGQAMLDELERAPNGEHASNLGAFMALEFAREAGCPALVVDPVATDELMDEARLTGLPEIRRRSIFHALGQRGAAREAASRLGLDYERGRFIVAHLGGGISVGAHRKGRVVDVTNAIDGEGPFSPERSGTLPLLPLLDLLATGLYTPDEMKAVVTSRAGLFAHLGTADLRRAEARMNAGDEQARQVFEALAYNVAKAISSMAPALRGRADAVVITGGMARSTRLTHEITRLTAFLGPVVVVTGVEEMRSMARGAMLALEGSLPVQEYPPAPSADPGDDGNK